jgi:hypothetical protein
MPPRMHLLVLTPDEPKSFTDIQYPKYGGRAEAVDPKPVLRDEKFCGLAIAYGSGVPAIAPRCVSVAV